MWDAKSSISTTCGTGLPILVGIWLKCLTQRYNFELPYVSFPHSQVGIFREAPHTPLNSDTENVSGRRPKVEATAKKEAPIPRLGTRLGSRAISDTDVKTFVGSSYA